MRFNRQAQVAFDDQGRALCGWLSEDTVGPYQRDLGGDNWQLVTRTNGTVTPVPGVSGGANAVASSDGQWMRRLDIATPPLTGSSAWSPLDGRVGDIDGPIALTLSEDKRTIRVFVDGAVVRDIPRGKPFDETRLKGQIAAWTEFNRTPNIVAWDVIENTAVPVVALPGPQYTPIVFEAPSGRWVLYQIDALRGVCHRTDDATQGYLFGTQKSIYDPDVILQGQGCVIGWSSGALQLSSEIRTLTIPVLGEGMVPLTVPVPVPDTFGPVSAPLQNGTTIRDTTKYVVGTPETFPRIGTHSLHQTFDGSNLYLQKFYNGQDFTNKRCYEHWFVNSWGVHHLLDASDGSGKDIYSFTDTRWIPWSMKVGYDNRFDTGPHENKHKRGSDCSVFKVEEYRRLTYVYQAWDKFDCGPELGIRRVIAVVYDPTGGFYGPGRYLELNYFAEGAGWVRWESHRASTVYASGSPVFNDASRAGRSDFYRLGGVAWTPQLYACSVSPTPEPIPVPIPPPSTDSLIPGQNILPDKPLISQDRRFTLLYQLDGNLVLYGPRGPMWATGTNGQSVGFVSLQGDGNFVVYDKSGRPRWASGTNGKPVQRLIVQNDGNVVLYTATAPVWATGTVYNPAPIPPIPIPPIPPGPGPIPDMHAWPKFGASYATGPWRRDYDPTLFASLNRDAGSNFTRYWLLDPWGVAPNGPGQHAGILPWRKDVSGVFDLEQPDPEWDQRLFDCIRIQNSAGATVQLSVYNLYAWSQRKEGLQWVPDMNLGPFRRNRNGINWADDSVFDFLGTSADWVTAQLIARMCAAAKGLAISVEACGNEHPQKEAHARMAALVRSHFTADWAPSISCNRNEDTPGQYFNMHVGGTLDSGGATAQFDQIAYHGKARIEYLDDIDTDEPSSRPNTFRKLFEQVWPEGSVDPKRIIMSSDGCRSGSGIDDAYNWTALRDVFQDHLRRGFTTEHQSRIKLRPFLENRLDLRDFEGDWLRSLRA